MRKLRMVEDGEGSDQLTGSVLFTILWDELTDLLGSAATAALLGRALRRALPRHRDLVGLTIERVDQRFAYVVPPSFELASGPPPALRDLVKELRPLLAELTGEVAQRHLEQVPELRRLARATARA